MKFIRYVLFPFAVIYDLITSIRNFCYDQGVFKSTSFSLPVIAVGNLSVGGTGKTPQIEYLITLLQGKKTAVLSRGYKRKTSGYVLLNDTHSSEDVGDEPLQFFRKFPNTSVAVHANRVEGIERLNKEVNPEVILLDDAYQHRKVQAGFYVLLTKYGDLYAEDFILPTGNLRESRRGSKRANVIVVTKCPEVLSEEEQQKIIQRLKPVKHQQVFFSKISYTNTLKGSISLTLDELVDHEVLLITGIAIPQPLLDFLDKKRVNYKHLQFPDHHHFSSSDIDRINGQFDAMDSEKKLILTTEKDYVRLSDRIADLSYIEIETQFLQGQKEFDQKILDFIVE